MQIGRHTPVNGVKVNFMGKALIYGGMEKNMSVDGSRVNSMDKEPSPLPKVTNLRASGLKTKNKVREPISGQMVKYT